MINTDSARPLSGGHGQAQGTAQRGRLWAEGVHEHPHLLPHKAGPDTLTPPAGECVLGGCPGRGRKRLRVGQQDRGQRGSALGVSILTTLCLHRSIFPSAGPLQPGGYFLPFSLSPPLPAPHPARLLPLLRPGGFPCCQKINLMLFITEGKKRRSPLALSTAAIRAAGHPRRDEGGRGIRREGCGRAARPGPAFISWPWG